jgi:hypothetical protein
MEDVGIFHGHAVNFTAILHILWSFVIFCGNLVSFPRFGILCEEKKSGNPDHNDRSRFQFVNLQFWRLSTERPSGTNVMIFKIFSPKKIGEKSVFDSKQS